MINKRNMTAACCAALCAACAITTPGCITDFGTGTDGSFVTFSILGRSFTLTFDGIGPIELRANETVRVPTAVRLFDETPPETPPTGQMTLPSTSVGVARRLTEKAAARAQSLPVTGSATVRFSIAAGQSAALCDTAVLLAEYDVSVTTGIASIRDEVYDLTREAMAAMMANDVTICIEVTADFDGEITIGEYYFAFGGGSAGATPPDARTVPPPLAGGLYQVPIDNAGGTAVAIAPNRTIAGVSYGVAGVLEAQTAAVTATPVDPSTITVVPADLGLLTVSTLYVATHSSFVPDVIGGVKLATLTVTYKSGAPTTFDFVTGSTTAEWSYGRPEHTSAYGGVAHTQAPVLYDFETSVDSASIYTGYVYSATIPVDAGRTMSSISLSMTDPETYAGSRLETGPIAGWAGQALTAITLAGLPLPAPEEPELRACCGPDGACVMADPIDCVGEFGLRGVPMGEGSTCEPNTCPTESEGESTACCMGAVWTVTREYVQTCMPMSAEECLAGYGVPQPPGVTCDTVVCDEPLNACCDPSSDDCWDMLFDVCMDLGWDAKAPGVHCDDFKCPSDLEACCFDDGQCVDTDPDTCIGNGGTPGGADTECALLECLGACCKPDGCCELTSLDTCDALGGAYQGFAIDCEPYDPCSGGYTCYTIINFPDPPRYRTVQPACSIDSGKLLRDFAGGGTDPTEPALFVDDIMPGRSYPTREEAAAECCKSLTDFNDDPAFMVTARSGGIEIGVDRIILDECDESGACCTSDGNCTDASRTDCTDLNSSSLGPTDFAGPGTSCSTTACAPPVEYVVWYTSNVCCWGAPHIVISDRDGFNAPDLRSNWPGGGISPTEPLTKVELQGGFATYEEAQAWFCPQLTSWSYHYWCGRHYQAMGGNWQVGAGTCDLSVLPQTDSPPDFNGCP